MVTALVLATGLWLNYIVFRDGPKWRRLLALAAVGIIILGLAVLRSRLPGRLGNAWRRFPAYGGLAALGLASWAGGVVLNHGLPPVPESRASAAGRPNVVLVVLDATRADHFSTYGYQRDTTPNLKRFAREAAVFTNAFSASDMTLPGHASIFTGQFSEWHGAHYWPKHIGGRPLSSRYTTLAEVLSSYGYTTLAVGANSAYLQRHFGLDQGFQVYDVRPVVTVINHERPWALRNALVRLASSRIFLPELELASRRADEITDDALKLTGQVRANTPFFLFLNYMDTHTPYIPPSSYRGRFGGKEGRMTYRQYLALEHAVRRRRKSVSPAQQNFLAARYDEALAFADEQVSRLLNGLRKRGVYENSLIIVTSDHGEAFGEEGFLEHSAGSLRPSQLRIPLLVKLPNTNAAARESRFTSQVDIFPTVCRFTGAPLPHAAQGRSLFEAPQNRELYSSVFTPRPQGPLISRALFTLGKKLVVPWRGQPSLYDLQLDPAEKVDLAGRNGSDFAGLMTRMQAYKSRLPKHAGTAQVKIESNTVDQLRSLGYLQ
jgi:arylsulfatase A-like enzyme